MGTRRYTLRSFWTSVFGHNRHVIGEDFFWLGPKLRRLKKENCIIAYVDDIFFCGHMAYFPFHLE
jgi:hypothetical protein